MKQFVCKPTIHMFPTCKDFLAGFDIGEEDLVLSNAYIFKPFFDGLDCRAKALFLEDYGQGEPSDTMVDALLAAASRYDFRRIIAIGGGSVIDVAKVLAVAPAGSDTSAVFDCKELKQEKELIILPTTCGTGSEVTNISIINRTCLGIKVGLVHDSLYARHAVLVPELLEKLPYPVFATSSLDALVHAVESYLSTAASPFTRMFSAKAIRLILAGYTDVALTGRDSLRPRLGDFLLASTYAGLAFGTAGCATVHAMSYPLGSTFHIPHGESNYAVFAGVLRHYEQQQVPGLADLQELLPRLRRHGQPRCPAAKDPPAQETVRLRHGAFPGPAFRRGRPADPATPAGPQPQGNDGSRHERHLYSPAVASISRPEASFRP